MLRFTPPEKPILEASIEVSYEIGKTRAPFNTRETLIKPATLKITEVISGKKSNEEDQAGSIVKRCSYFRNCRNEL